jgi:hypothetical protein
VKLSDLRSAYLTEYVNLRTWAERFAPEDVAARAARYGIMRAVKTTIVGSPTVCGAYVEAYEAAGEYIAGATPVGDGPTSHYAWDTLPVPPEGRLRILQEALQHVHLVVRHHKVTTAERFAVLDAILDYDPAGQEFMNLTIGSTPRFVTAVILAVLVDAEEHPPEVDADLIQATQRYADGELHRALGWAERARQAQEAPHGITEPGIRDQGLSDTEGTTDHLEGYGPHRTFDLGSGAWPT